MNTAQQNSFSNFGSFNNFSGGSNNNSSGDNSATTGSTDNSVAQDSSLLNQNIKANQQDNNTINPIDQGVTDRQNNISQNSDIQENNFNNDLSSNVSQGNDKNLDSINSSSVNSGRVETVKLQNNANNDVVPPNNTSSANENSQEMQEIANLRAKIEQSAAPEDLKEQIYTMIKRLERMARTGVYSREYDILSNYIDWVVKVPWNKFAEEVLDIGRVKQILDANHYGLEPVKERVLQYIAMRKLLVQKKDFKAMKRSPVLCMVGLQGIGKTTMAKSIAKALNRPFYRISMGAIGSILEIRGRNKAVEGAEPGQIIKALVRTGVRNPVILLDELDKASGQAGLLADVMATMLEILDPEQNTSFRDHYLDYPFDLSDVMFIVSANKIGTFSAALLDRLEVIKMGSYTDEEKQAIARDYLLPRVRQTTGLEEDQLEFSPDVWPLLIRPLGFDSGIRSLQRMLENMARKAALEIVTGKTNKVYITPENFKDYLPK